MKSLGERIKRIFLDYGVIGGMTGYTAVMPGIGTTILLGVMYKFSPWLQTNWEIGVLLIILIMTTLSGVALLAINLLGVVSGFAFGFSLGLLTYLIGILGASTVMFLLAKRFVSSGLEHLLESKPKLNVVRRALINESAWRTFFVLILIRLTPAVPFAATNFVVSASGISLRVLIAATIVGMLPRASAVVFVGASLSELNLAETQSYWIIVVGILATILAIVLIGIVSRRALRNMALDAPTETTEKI